MDICKAINAKGKPCTRLATSTNGYCHWHGGQFTPTKFVEVLSDTLNLRYNELYNDPELLSMRHEIALVDIRLEALLSQLGTGESSEAWKKLHQTLQRFHDAVAVNDQDLQTVCLTELDEIAVNQYGDSILWNNIHAIIEQRRRLVETEQKRAVMFNEYFSKESAFRLINALTTAVRDHVPDMKALEAISEDLKKIYYSHTAPKP
jgi:hypothetical protein